MTEAQLFKELYEVSGWRWFFTGWGFASLVVSLIVGRIYWVMSSKREGWGRW